MQDTTATLSCPFFTVGDHPMARRIPARYSAGTMTVGSTTARAEDTTPVMVHRDRRRVHLHPLLRTRVRRRLLQHLSSRGFILRRPIEKTKRPDPGLVDSSNFSDPCRVTAC